MILVNYLLNNGALVNFLGYNKGSFPITEKQSTQILTLPINQYLKKIEIIYICKLINKFYS